MRKLGIVLVIILGLLAVLLVGATGIVGFGASSMSRQWLNGIGATISAIFLALIIGMDGLSVIFMVRTPNMRWQP